LNYLGMKNLCSFGMEIALKRADFFTSETESNIERRGETYLMPVWLMGMVPTALVPIP
jgi:hypothetical protein